MKRSVCILLVLTLLLGGVPVFAAESPAAWDGTVDLSWYDPAQDTFYLSTPAQLAGLAALVNGSVDASVTGEKIIGDRSLLAAVLVEDYLILGEGGGNVKSDVHMGSPAFDFSDKTVYLTADLDMGGLNWTPIGGIWPMDPQTCEYMVVSHFNGVLDGQGHRITNLHCDRYGTKGFAYSQNVGLVGELGQLYADEPAPSQIPAVRNLSVSGDLYGRRSVGGIVGCGGTIPTGIRIENCANHAAVKNTDSKGVAGIIGRTAYQGAIVNCYNDGPISTTYSCPAGGICGSNRGMDIYNCYNAGTIDSNGNRRGRGVGGHDMGAYTVSDCYFLDGCDDDPDADGYYCTGALNVTVSVEKRTQAQMRAASFVAALNSNGAAYVENPDGLPLLWWERQEPAQCTLTLVQPQGGSVQTGCGTTVPAGTVLTLSNAPDGGYAFRCYTLDGVPMTGRYATITRDAQISAEFEPMQPGALHITPNPACTVTVRKSGTVMEDGAAKQVTDYPVADGDPLYENDVLTATAVLNDGAKPLDPNMIYSGEFRWTFVYETGGAAPKVTDTGRFTVDHTVTAAPLSLSVEAKTTHKTWIQQADTDWYRDGETRFTLTGARQLAGLAQLVRQGVDFAGKTVRLGADVSLLNNDETYGTSVRWWDGIGMAGRPFCGTFDGCGHRITGMTAYSAGSGAALFLNLDGAVVENLAVSGTAEAAGSAAGIAAQMRDSTVRGCISAVDVTSGGDNAAGIAAQANGESRIEYCVNEGAVTGKAGLGGIVGVLEGGAVSDCVNFGAVTGNGTSAGLGGVAGQIRGVLTRCANYGAVGGSGWYAGGVAGYMAAEGAALTDCYNTAAVSNAHAYASSGTGGLAGYGFRYAIDSCFDSGTVARPAAGTFGAILGRDAKHSSSTVNNVCYLDTACVFASNGETGKTGVTALTAAQLKDLTVDEHFCAGGAYPELRFAFDLQNKDACTHLYTFGVDPLEPTCTEPGSTGELHCMFCGSIAGAGEQIPPAGHRWDAGTVIVEPTETEPGSRTRTCTVCGESKTETIPPLGAQDRFVDVPEDQFYYDPVLWAVGQGITNGVDETHFKPDNTCKRGQIVTFLWRAQGSPAPRSTDNPFVDVKPDDYFYEAVLWAVEQGITTGVDTTHFKPDNFCTRAHAVTFLWRNRAKPAPQSTNNPFVDVAASAYFYDAVLWAVEQGITNGVDATHFKPDNPCKRSQIVTFLYRDLAQ